MEATMGAFFDEDWDSLGKIFFTEDAADLMLQFHGDASLFTNGSDDDTTTQVLAAPSIFWPVNGGNCNQNVAAGVDGSTTMICSDTFLDYTNNYDFQNISQESSNSSASESANDGFFPNQSHEFFQANFDVNHLLQVTNDSTDGSMDFCLPDNKNSSFVLPPVMEDIICPREEITMEGNNTGNADSQLQGANNNVANLENEIQLKRKINSTLELQIDAADGQTNIGECSENPKKKKSRVARNAPKTKKNVQPKSKKNKQQKDKQIISNEDDEPNTVQNGQSSTCYSSEDESNASQESNAGTTSDDKGPALNLNGKTRATRGAATDPQSLYARKRRERINERLRILQNLIPNGTKVDISTMLEEAVHYVKFLQLQIKLLSSDDMWMYAPIVYNGLDIGLFGRIFPTP